MKKFLAALLLLAPVTQAQNVITTDGTFIENQTFNGMVQVRAHDVTLRNCTFIGSRPSMAWSKFGLMM
jgi:hypothetical protein